MKNILKLIMVWSVLLVGGFANAQDLDVEIMKRAEDGLDTCAFGQIAGLKADGDGFLAVRKGPGTNHDKIDELVNGDKLWLFEENNGWYGIVYGVKELSCSPVENDRPVQTNGKKGWVFGKWVDILAG